MEAQVVLCDWAETVNGKLYIMGAGWVKTIANQPVSIAVAVIVRVPWTEANRQHTLELTLLTEDGHPASPAPMPAPPGVTVSGFPDPPPLRLEGKFEVGRPPGTKEGSALPAPLSFRIPVLPLNPGGYKFQLKIDGVEVSSASFEAEGAPSQRGGLSQ